MDIKRLIEVRKRIKKKKPAFIRQDAHKKKRLGVKWRKPRGLHSKVRLGLKGYRKKISKGYKSPSLIKGFHSSGLKVVAVSSVKDINKIKNEEEGIIIKKQVGLKKKIEIIKKAIESSIKILNIKKPSDFLKAVEVGLKKKKDKKDAKLSEKERKKKEKEVIAKEKKKKGETKETKTGEKEDIEKEKKKEIDKVLTKKDI